jgi:hypothetical protein
MQDIIWAFSRTPPESTEADAHFAIHQKFGRGSLNLTRVQPTPAEQPPPFPPPPPPHHPHPPPAPPAPEPEPETEESESDAKDESESESGGGGASFVHGVLCSVAFLLVIPSGALVARYAKVTDSSKAFQLHRLLQFGIGSCTPSPTVLLF